MNHTSPEPSQPASAYSKAHARFGIASYVVGALALTSAAVLIDGFFQGYWSSDGNSLIEKLQLPCITPFLILLGAGLGFTSLSDKSNKRNVFGILGLLMSLLTTVACCFLSVLIFASGGGFGG